MSGFAPILAALALAQTAPSEAAAEPPAPAAEAPAPASEPPVAKEPAAAATPAPASAGASAPPPRRRAPAADPAADRAEAESAARAFLSALVARDEDALAAAAADRFSFDGDVQAGRDAIRRTWRALLAGRQAPPAPVRTLEVLAATEAVARLGNPPARIAPLARAGVLVAVADVGGRAVVLFLAREGGRMAVLGMHD